MVSMSRCVRMALAARMDAAIKGGPLGAISITCPTTNKPVSTGMTMEPESFYRSVLTGTSVKCPHCGVTHIWSKVDAKFD